MNIYRKLSLFVLILGCFVLSTPGWAADGYTNAPKPGWVKEEAIPSVNGFPKDQVQNGVYYLLIDDQIRVEKGKDPEFYYHSSEYIVNQAGVEANSQINIGFYSEYQKVALHSLRVIRDGKIVNKLTTSRIKVIQGENEMDDLIYKGQKTLNIILDDVRVGDIIDYSYSRNGMNPVYKQLFSYDLDTSWSVPVGRLSIRLLWHKPNELHYSVRNSNDEVAVAKTRRGVEYTIQKNNIAPIKMEDDTPSWYSPWGIVYFSEVKSWAEVAQWSEPLFDHAMVSDSHLEELADSIREKHTDKKERISAALRFVQDEIRYLGIELGQNTHKPTPAFKTLENRYGDCKDKTVLFITLLKQLDIEAYPALVNTQEKLENVLPGTRAFNHVITYFELDGQKYWVDPTRSYQHGNIDSVHQPDYDMALILKPGTTDLTKMSPRQSPYGVSVKDSFVLHADNSVDFTSVTENKGWNAERSRKQFADSGRDELQTEFLNFYQKYYPEIKVVEPVTHVDDDDHNVFVTTERYQIDKFWDDNKEKRQYYGDFYPNIISPPLKVRGEPVRKDPLYMTHPNYIKQEIDVKFDDDAGWSFKNDSFVEENPYFTFERTTTFDKSKRLLVLSYTYQSKMDNVPAEGYQDYLAALKKVSDYKSYSIFKNYPKPAAPATQATPATPPPLVCEVHNVHIDYCVYGGDLCTRVYFMENRQAAKS